MADSRHLPSETTGGTTTEYEYDADALAVKNARHLISPLRDA
ncbi:MAG: hypothetical protein ACYTAN_14230 [Planctomycetota bacterium]|jgi:YD repeat-containing protein